MYGQYGTLRFMVKTIAVEIFVNKNEVVNDSFAVLLLDDYQ